MTEPHADRQVLAPDDHAWDAMPEWVRHIPREPLIVPTPDPVRVTRFQVMRDKWSDRWWELRVTISDRRRSLESQYGLHLPSLGIFVVSALLEWMTVQAIGSVDTSGPVDATYRVGVYFGVFAGVCGLWTLIAATRIGFDLWWARQRRVDAKRGRYGA